MRRGDRLFQIVQLLRGRRRATRAADIARQLGISERTVYRDIRDLVLAGTPIDGEAGVGYRMRPGYDLPPLMFDREEIQALVLGARIVRQFGDPALARASQSILNKISAVLPADLAPFLDDTRLFVPGIVSAKESAGALGIARDALIDRRKLRLHYADAKGAHSERIVRPLGIFFWGRIWTLAAWCELRTDFRSFRLDRVTSAAALAQTFADEPGRTLKDMLGKYGPDVVRLLDT
ncbi:MAG TPA: YafY family protein [Vicinamibacterales bacterium]|nr:YafY family protein [Vicinamibacterales bacterium]